MKVLVIVATLFTVAQAQRFYADGGFIADGAPIECDVDWQYAPDKDAAADGPFTGCVAIADFPPFDSDSASLNPPSFGAPTTQWCSFKGRTTGDNVIYRVEAGGTVEEQLQKQQAWGYCVETPNLTPQADGGFLNETVDCDTDWVYKNASIESREFNGCVSISEFEPFEVDATTSDVTDPRTDRTRWCSVKQNLLGLGNPNYDFTTNTDAEIKLRAWGYCLDGPATLLETEVTDAPTANNATDAPVSDTPTAAPTATTGVTEAPTSGTNTTLAPNGGKAGADDSDGLSSGEVAAAVIIPLLIVFGGIGAFAFYRYQQLASSGAGGAGAKYEAAKDSEAPKDAESGTAPEATETKEPMEDIKLG